MVDAHADPALIGRQVVDAVGADFPQLWIHEIMHLDRLWLPLGQPLLPFVVEGTDQFFFLGIDRDYRLAFRLKAFSQIRDMPELGIPVTGWPRPSCVLRLDCRL